MTSFEKILPPLTRVKTLVIVFSVILIELPTW